MARLITALIVILLAVLCWLGTALCYALTLGALIKGVVLLESKGFMAYVWVIVGGLLIAKGGWWLDRLARRLVKLLEDPKLRNPFVLLLRSFKDDGKPINTASSALEVDFTTLEDVLARMFKEKGTQLVKLRNRARLPDLGVTSVPADEKEWTGTVARLVQEAHGIVLFLNSTEGLKWELRHLIENAALRRTLIVFPPHSDFSGPERREAMQQRWRAFRDAMAAIRQETKATWLGELPEDFHDPVGGDILAITLTAEGTFCFHRVLHQEKDTGDEKAAEAAYREAIQGAFLALELARSQVLSGANSVEFPATGS